jgi:hypothetical protein
MRILISKRTMRGLVEAFLLPSTLAAVLALLILLERWARTVA